MQAMSKRTQNKRGRPPIEGEPMTQLAVRLTAGQLRAVDKIRERRRGIPSRTSIIREVIERGLEVIE
jgi:hypothetical protein